MKCIRQLTKLRSNLLIGFLSWFIILCVATVLIGCSSSKKNTRFFVENTTLSEKKNNEKQRGRVSDEKLNKYKMALSRMKNREYKKATSLFKAVSSVYPQLVGPHINMGIIALKQNDFMLAETNFKSAIAIKPDNAEVYNLLGVAYRQQGRFPDARNAYKKALSLDENMKKPYLNLGILNDLYLGDYVKAKAYYKKYQELNARKNSGKNEDNSPNDEKVNMWLADLNARIQASAQ